MSEPKDPAESADAARSGDPIDTRLVRKLAAIFKDTDLTEIEVESDGLRIRLARGSAVVAAPAPVALVHATAAVAPVAAAPAAPAAPAVAAAPERAAGDLVKSPMVGTVYLSPQPGAEVFVKPGDKVVEGQTLLIIEAMKTMNPIAAPRAGVVAELLVGDAQPVEYGEPLCVLA